MPHLILTANLKEMDTAMHRPSLLQRADEMFPLSTGHVLAAMATAMQEQVDGSRCAAARRSHAITSMAR
jgi:hypothetical protein